MGYFNKDIHEIEQELETDINKRTFRIKARR